MDLTGLQWLLSLTLGSAGLGFGLFLLVGLATFSYYLSPYYPFVRFVLKRLCRRSMATAG